MTVLPMVLISVGVIMRMCAMLVLPVLVLSVVVFAVIMLHLEKILYSWYS